MVEAMGLQRTFWFVKTLAMICHFSWLSQTKCRASEAVHNYQRQNFVIFSGGLFFCFILDFFGPFFQVWNEDLLFSVCVAVQSCAELQPYQVELLFGSKTYPKNRKCGYKWQQLAGRTCSDAILELLLIFSTQFQVKHPFKLIRAITVSLEHQWRNWSHERNLSISWILRRC